MAVHSTDDGRAGWPAARTARMRAAGRWLGAGVWAGSWYLMYLEITRWHHVRPTLAFNSDPIPGTDIRPHPGLPLLLLYAACLAAPITDLVASRPPGRRPLK